MFEVILHHMQQEDILLIRLFNCYPGQNPSALSQFISLDEKQKFDGEIIFINVLEYIVIIINIPSDHISIKLRI